jgi:hypothetical protein
MLTRSKDGKQLRERSLQDCINVLAEWDDQGNLVVDNGGWILNAENIAKLQAFITDGPPKKRYRITRTFEEKPEWVGVVYRSVTLNPEDIEEVQDADKK